MQKILAALLTLAMALCAGGAMADDALLISDYSDGNGTYSYYIFENEIYITGWNGTATTIEIPAEINGKSVVSIDAFAFQNESLLTSVKIPHGVERIDAYAFASCGSLVSLSIPSTVTEIGMNAFEYCERLENVSLPSGLKSIGWGAFNGCKSLQSITIPSGVQSIKNITFMNCESLTSVTIGEGVTNIGKNAFADCDSLERVVIPKNVTSLEWHAFGYCDSLKRVTFERATPPSLGTALFVANSSMEMIDEILVPCGSIPAYQAALSEDKSNKEHAGKVRCAFHGEGPCPPPADALADLPKTGDASMLGAWVSLLGASCAGMKLRRRKK